MIVDDRQSVTKELNVDITKSENEAKLFEYHALLKSGGVSDFELISSSRKLRLYTEARMYLSSDDKATIKITALLCSDILLLLKKSKRLFGNGLQVRGNNS